MRILLLCDYRSDGPATVLDHIHALQQHAGHDVSTLSMLGDLPDRLDLDQFEAIIVHYSLVIASDSYLAPLARYRLRKFKGLKAVFIQDEYRWVNRTVDALCYLKAHVLFTCVPESEIEKVYPTGRLPGLRKVNVLTGYVPKELTIAEPLPYDERSIDVGYRSRKISAAYGELGREKWLIADLFQKTAEHYGLKCDISYEEGDRLYGVAWADFVRSCRAMLGAESGASVFDMSGDILPAVLAHEEREPQASFELVRERYFPKLDGVVRMNQISPRCFEVAALRTLMILYEGEYSGILVPWRHYVPLRKDHSNEEEVVAALRDKATWERLTNNAYEEIALNPTLSFESFGRYVGEVLDQELKRVAWRSPRGRVEAEAFEHLAQRSALHVKGKLARIETLSKFHAHFDRFVIRSLPLPLANAVKSVARGVYQSMLRVWRSMSRLRHYVEAIRHFGIPFWSLISLGSKRDLLLEDLTYVEKLSRYGRAAKDVAGTAPFRLVYERATEHLKLVGEDGPEASGRTNDFLEATNMSIFSSPRFAVREVSVVLDDVECHRLSVSGEEKRPLEGLTLLLRRHPQLGIRLFKGGPGQSVWFDQLVFV